MMKCAQSREMEAKEDCIKDIIKIARSRLPRMRWVWLKLIKTIAHKDHKWSYFFKIEIVGFIYIYMLLSALIT